ncbi:MAG: CBS domain-containing protein [Legionellales bacterium]|nr:CBS domain-containing protein [Legionellales bacterium]
MKTEDPPPSWLKRLKKLLHLEPQSIEQLITVIRETQKQEIIDTETLTMIEGVILFSQMQVRDIMLPKNQMTCIDHETTLSNVFTIVTESGHSRFPVTDSKQEVIGILHAKDLLRLKTHENTDNFLSDIVRQATFVPESKRLDLLLSDFRANRNHMAIVVDEYGAVSGFVTLEDIIEQIIGDIEDEFDIDEEAYIKAHADSHYILKAHTPIDEFNEQLHAHFSDESYDTMGGIVMSHFGYLPKRGEIITIDHFEFKVINADARRIKLLACFDKRDHQTNKG